MNSYYFTEFMQFNFVGDLQTIRWSGQSLNSNSFLLEGAKVTTSVVPDSSNTYTIPVKWAEGYLLTIPGWCPPRCGMHSRAVAFI